MHACAVHDAHVRAAQRSAGKMLAYNLSPSFNWDAAGMDDTQIEEYMHSSDHCTLSYFSSVFACASLGEEEYSPMCWTSRAIFQMAS